MTEAKILTATAADRTSVRAFDQGQGPAILSKRFRVVRLHRRQ